MEYRHQGAYLTHADGIQCIKFVQLFEKLKDQIDMIGAASENLLRHAVNHDQCLRIPMDQRQTTLALLAHLVDVLPVNDGVQTIFDFCYMIVSY